MGSRLPKVMHQIAGTPLIAFPIRAALEAGAEHIVVVVGYRKELVTDYVKSTFADRATTAEQLEQKGTGHATAQALPAIPDSVERVLILCGDTPLLKSNDLSRLVEALDNAPQAQLSMLTCVVEDPTGYGRILRDDSGRVCGIREDRDLDGTQRGIREVNPGVYCARTAFLRIALPQLRSDNAQEELYLTDVVSLAANSGGVVDVAADGASLVGVNDRQQLLTAEAVLSKESIAHVRQRDNLP